MSAPRDCERLVDGRGVAAVDRIRDHRRVRLGDGERRRLRRHQVSCRPRSGAPRRRRTRGRLRSSSRSAARCRKLTTTTSRLPGDVVHGRDRSRRMIAASASTPTRGTVESGGRQVDGDVRAGRQRDECHHDARPEPRVVRSVSRSTPARPVPDAEGERPDQRQEADETRPHPDPQVLLVHEGARPA